ncbi:hypothetical protein [Thioalkalivibrio sp. XN279]|uniref:hypothetical protein n=1 Tax=Thioalkalivibrio sp. XN279 TaxID=2714953 RepID=UPI00140A0005|nr:hypothetical protein [Thioalkalivibrio sp. XN279]NHA13464.1 hypothetical protein [Thioalkalivibrio sp. XN279]
MRRTLRLSTALALSLAAANAAGAELRLEAGKPLPCSEMWVFDLSREHLPGTFHTFHFSSKGKEFDERFAQGVKDGEADVMIDLIATTLEKGAHDPVSVTLAGVREVLEPMLERLAARLEEKRLPYLSFLFVGPRELEPKARALIVDREALFWYVEYAAPDCGAEGN